MAAALPDRFVRMSRMTAHTERNARLVANRIRAGTVDASRSVGASG
jgi:hypothetical protein